MLDILGTLQRLESHLELHSGPFTVRCLEPGDKLPDLPHKLPDLACIQREWIWVASEGDREPSAMLVAAPVHNLVFLSRLVTSTCASAAILVPLFRKALADMRLRGYTGYVVCLGNNPIERKLAKLAKHSGARVIEQSCMMLSGSTENKL